MVDDIPLNRQEPDPALVGSAVDVDVTDVRFQPAEGLAQFGMGGEQGVHQIPVDPDMDSAAEAHHGGDVLRLAPAVVGLHAEADIRRSDLLRQIVESPGRLFDGLPARASLVDGTAEDPDARDAEVGAEFDRPPCGIHIFRAGAASGQLHGSGETAQSDLLFLRQFPGFPAFFRGHARLDPVGVSRVGPGFEAGIAVRFHKVEGFGEGRFRAGKAHKGVVHSVPFLSGI